MLQKRGEIMFTNPRIIDTRVYKLSLHTLTLNPHILPQIVYSQLYTLLISWFVNIVFPCFYNIVVCALTIYYLDDVSCNLVRSDNLGVFVHFPAWNTGLHFRARQEELQ